MKLYYACDMAKGGISVPLNLHLLPIIFTAFRMNCLRKKGYMKCRSVRKIQPETAVVWEVPERR